MQVKLNVVVMKSVNDHELPDFVAMTADADIEVRFIEFMPFTDNRWSADKVLPKQAILDHIAQYYNFSPLEAAPIQQVSLTR
ncbi:hypothetical protein MKQ70_11505 [Chitinophaga sedimenti]|uniref:hypothetical protein n=1 Tax=Chitinophaga sedimenti TaxID=2033606 RepID=UPI0020036D39|nr:hypothetical protein [Chitinophaga sedimenti]MCK7555603.1 hypothetical protein [Chitinophaga sedimenti]